MVQEIISTLLQVILPLSIPVIAGVILVKKLKFETKHILTLVLYFLTPALIFQRLYTAQISNDDVVKTIGFCIANMILLWALSKLAGKMLKLPATHSAGLTLVSTFTNSVNYGLPLVLLAFGNEGLDKAAVYVITQMLLINTFGVYFAARSNFSIAAAIKSVFSLPAIYAAALALLFRALNIQLIEGLEKGISMISQAYSPVVLTVLGAQMASVKIVKLSQENNRTFLSGMVLRLLISPLAALAILFAFKIEGVLFPTLFILASMPVAVNAVVLAEKYHAAAPVVSKCILWTTIASFFTLPVVINLVR